MRVEERASSFHCRVPGELTELLPGTSGSPRRSSRGRSATTPPWRLQEARCASPRTPRPRLDHRTSTLVGSVPRVWGACGVSGGRAGSGDRGVLRAEGEAVLVDDVNSTRETGKATFSSMQVAFHRDSGDISLSGDSPPRSRLSEGRIRDRIPTQHSGEPTMGGSPYARDTKAPAFAEEAGSSDRHRRPDRRARPLHHRGDC